MKSIFFCSAFTALFVFAGINVSSAQQASGKAASTGKGKPAMQRSNDDASGQVAKPLKAKTGTSRIISVDDPETLQTATPAPVNDNSLKGRAPLKPADGSVKSKTGTGAKINTGSKPQQQTATEGLLR